jgi:hypothetical protein
MTPEQFIAQLKRQKSTLQAAAEQSLEEAAKATHFRVATRIFSEGKAADEGKIGNYSTKPLVVSKKAFVTKSAFRQSQRPNKGGGTRPMFIKFPNAKKATPVMVLPGGYRQLKQIQGLKSQYVDLVYTGRTQRAFIGSLRKFGRYGWAAVMRGTKTAEKAVLNENKFGKKIFALTPQEKRFFSNRFVTAFNKKSQIP